jgi:copper(I)-binding protein
MKRSLFCISLLAGVLTHTLATAQPAATSPGAPSVQVTDSWARATVQGQKATGAFMKLTAKENLKLVGVTSPVAGVTEIHEMKMDKDVMKMAAIASLDLPAGQAVELKPGGYHVMLMDLKQNLAKDAFVPVTLQFQDTKGKKSQLELKVPVLMQPPGTPAGGGMPAAHMHGDHKH